MLSGGIDISATVSSGGAEIVSSGGIAGGITILKGGVELAANDGVISGAVQRAPGNNSEADAMRGTAAAVELFVFQG